MTNEKFTEIVEQRLERIKTLLILKGVEYSRNSDRFHNFHRAGVITNTTPEKALIGFMNKHLVSVLDIVDDIDKGTTPCVEAVEEKLGDLILYLILLEGLLKKRIEDENN